MPQIILALPAFNEAACIEPLLDAAIATFDSLDEYTARILVVDDGSTDNTAEVVRLYAEKARRNNHSFDVEVICHPHNRGLGPAIITSLKAALERSHDPRDVIVNMDADNTHPPDAIPQMLQCLMEEADVVIASRYRPGSRQVGVPFKRRLLSLGARWLFRWRLNVPGVRDYTCGYRAYHADLIRRAFDHYGGQLITRAGFACTDEILVKISRLSPRPVIREVPFILRYDRKRGESKLNLFQTVKETFKMLFRG